MVLNPSILNSTLYVPGGIWGNTYLPASLVRFERVALVARFVVVTSTPGITAADLSVTVPLSEVVPCDHPTPANIRTNDMTKKTYQTDFFIALAPLTAFRWLVNSTNRRSGCVRPLYLVVVVPPAP